MVNIFIKKYFTKKFFTPIKMKGILKIINFNPFSKDRKYGTKKENQSMIEVI